MLTRPRRLAIWFGAGVIIVVGAPIAYATDGGVPAHVPTAVDHPAKPAADSLRDAPYPTVGYLQARNGDVMTVLYRDAAISRVPVGDGAAGGTAAGGTMTGETSAGHPGPGI